MTITSSDLVFFGAEFPLDVAYGGGRITGTAVIDGTDNNVFPNVSEADRSAGRVQLRKVYAAVVSENTDTLLGTQIDIEVGDTDAGTDTLVFVYGDQTTNRGQAAAAVAALPYAVTTTPQPFGTFDQVPGQPTQGTCSISPPVGALCALTQPLAPGVIAQFVIVESVTGAGPYTVTFDRDVSTIADTIFRTKPTSAPYCYGVAETTATSGADSVVVNRVEAQIVPSMPTYPTAVNLFDPIPLRPVGGKVPLFRIGDAVVLRDGATTEVARVAFVDYTGGLTFEANLANSYGSGSTVSSLCDLGDITSFVASSFSQQTWTRLFSDSLIGNPISANYNRTAGSITTSNLGAATDRWAIVFTSPTDFKLIGEIAGQIATGSTSTDFSPTNPLTGAPYFTIDADGWGSGWANGNVLRFNTVSARVAFWMARSISPSSPGGDDSVLLEIRGSV